MCLYQHKRSAGRPHVRFGGDDPGEHFYSHAFRFEEMFSRLIEPLARNGRSHLTAEYVGETATCHRKHVYEFDDVDLILLEWIFLFKPELQQCDDFRLSIDCRFKTAWERALSRSQEGLPPADTMTQSLPMSASTFRRSECTSSEIVPVTPLTSYL